MFVSFKVLVLLVFKTTTSIGPCCHHHLDLDFLFEIYQQKSQIIQFWLMILKHVQYLIFVSFVFLIFDFYFIFEPNLFTRPGWWEFLIYKILFVFGLSGKSLLSVFRCL